MSGVQGEGVYRGCCVKKVDVQGNLSAQVQFSSYHFLGCNISQSRPLSNQNEAVGCLSVSEKAVSQLWKHNVLKKQYEIKYRVKVEKVD